MKNNFIPGTLFYHNVYNSEYHELIIVCTSSLHEHQVIICDFHSHQILYTSVSTSYLSTCVDLNNVKKIHPGISVSKTKL